MQTPGTRSLYILGLIGRMDTEGCHDAAAAVLRDGEVLVALEQERLSRRRHAPGESAVQAARACLAAAGLTLDDIDHIAYGWLEPLREPRCLTPEIAASSELTPVILPPETLSCRHRQVPPPISFVRHHRAHMAASFHLSGFPEAAGLILDGQGEDESISLWHGRGGELVRLRGYGVKASLGMFYEAAAFYAGLGWDAAGKLMGLASYGSPTVEIELSVDPGSGEIRLPPQIEEQLGEGDCDAHTIGQLWIDYFRSRCYPFTVGNPDEVMYYQDFAASVQRKLEEIACGLADHASRRTGSRRLVLGGGVALNCGMNQAIASLGLFEDLYVFPAANDSGTSVGAALALHHQLGGSPSGPERPMRRTDLGLSFERERIQAALVARGLPAEALDAEELTGQAAGVLAQGGILCWFSGRDEFGPRALGQRSLLADPRQRGNLARLNRIKGRELWRPIAPSVLAEHAASVFDAPVNASLGRFMLTVATVSAGYRHRIPAVVHVDGTARPHLVERSEQPLFWQLIESFRRQTGLPLVCNTSLNVRGEPLVHTPEQAIQLFEDRPDVDALVMAPYFLLRVRR